jgi:hypothetical protein
MPVPQLAQAPSLQHLVQQMQAQGHRPPGTSPVLMALGPQQPRPQQLQGGMEAGAAEFMFHAMQAQLQAVAEAGPSWAQLQAQAQMQAQQQALAQQQAHQEQVMGPSMAPALQTQQQQQHHHHHHQRQQHHYNHHPGATPLCAPAGAGAAHQQNAPAPPAASLAAKAGIAARKAPEPPPSDKHMAYGTTRQALRQVRQVLGGARVSP